MAIRVENDVLGFQVSVDDRVTMKALESQNDLSCIESCSGLSKLLFFSQMEEKLATVQEVDDEVEAFWCLKCIVQLDNERVLNPLQDHSLDASVRGLTLA